MVFKCASILTYFELLKGSVFFASAPVFRQELFFIPSALISAFILVKGYSDLGYCSPESVSLYDLSACKTFRKVRVAALLRLHRLAVQPLISSSKLTKQGIGTPT